MFGCSLSVSIQRYRESKKYDLQAYRGEKDRRQRKEGKTARRGRSRSVEPDSQAALDPPCSGNLILSPNPDSVVSPSTTTTTTTTTTTDAATTTTTSTTTTT